MAALPESATNYPAAVRQIDSGEFAVGGDTTKPPNEQFLSLASRTAYLKAQLEGIQIQVQSLLTTLDGLTIGQEVQAHSAALDGLAALILQNNQLLGTSGTGNITQVPVTQFQPADTQLTALGNLASVDNLVALANLALTNNRLFGTNASSTISLLNRVAIAVMSDAKASGTSAGDGTVGSWVRRTLNTLTESITGTVTLNGDSTFTLAAGTYAIFAKVPATMVDKHQARLQNLTDTATTARGSSQQTLDGAAVSGQSISTDSWILTTFTITGSKNFAIEHMIRGLLSGRGLGAEVTEGGEVYTMVVVVRLN